MNVLQTSVFMYKLYNRLLPENFSFFLCLNNDIHQHYIRSHNNFHLISVKTNIRKFSLKFRGSAIWNKISEIYRFAISMSSFKKLVRDCLINGYFDIISYVFYILIAFLRFFVLLLYLVCFLYIP